VCKSYLKWGSLEILSSNEDPIFELFLKTHSNFKCLFQEKLKENCQNRSSCNHNKFISKKLNFWIWFSFSFKWVEEVTLCLSTSNANLFNKWRFQSNFLLQSIHIYVNDWVSFFTQRKLSWKDHQWVSTFFWLNLMLWSIWFGIWIHGENVIYIDRRLQIDYSKKNWSKKMSFSLCHIHSSLWKNRPREDLIFLTVIEIQSEIYVLKNEKFQWNLFIQIL